MAVIEVFAGNVFIPAQVAATNIKVLSVISELALTQGQAETPAARDVVSTLSLRHTARTTYGLYAVSVASSLNFLQFIHPRSFSFSVSSFLALSGSTAHPLFEYPVSTLELTHSVVGDRALHSPHTLTLTQTVTVNHVRSESLSQSIGFSSLVGPYIPNRTFYNLERPLPAFPEPVEV